jgi:hypothetical protein
LATSEFILIKKSENSGPLVPTTELLILRERILKWRDELEKDETAWGSIDFKIDEKLNSHCHEII